jgi:hypothetical protein
MAASRNPPAQPGASSVGQSTPSKDQEEVRVPRPDAPGPRKTKTYGPPALPPPLRPVGPPVPYGAPTPNTAVEEEADEQTTVDPQAMGLRDPSQEGDGDPDVDPDPKSTTTTEAMAEEPRDLLLDPGDSANPLADQLATGTGETGASVDELTQDESRHVPQLEIVREPPLLVGGRSTPRLPPPGEVALSPAWLVVQSGPDRGRRFALRSGRTSIGRGVDNDVVLTDIAVSRRHLSIQLDGALYVMSDLGSGNGTLINDRDEDGAHRLAHGDKMELGNTVLVFECTAVGFQPNQAIGHAGGKWQGPDEDELSTVAGRRSVKPTLDMGGAVVPPPFARAPSHGPMTGPPPIPRPPPPIRTGPTPPGPALGPRPSPLSTPPGPPLAARSPSGPNIARARSISGAPSTDAPLSQLGAHSPLSVPAGSFSFPPPGGPVGHISGARPLPVPPPPYPAGGFSMSPSPASSPRFQYPNGVMAPLPAAERRRVLIGILGVAFVAVAAGIVMALVHGGGDTPASKIAATTAAKTAAPSDPTVATTTAGQPIAGALPGRATSSLSELYGQRELRPTDFGTDEEFLADTTTSTAQAGPVRDTQVALRDSDPGEATSADEPAISDEPNRRRRRSRADRDVELPDSSDYPDVPDVDEVESGSSRGDVDTAMRQAEELYRQKKFADAAALLHRAAVASGRKDVGRLRALATKYAKIGSLMAEGQDSMVSDAPRALQAFKTALRLDEEFGDSVHDRAIGARIAQVAPTAAGGYMARKEYAEAKAAADMAEKFGAGDSDRIQNVRRSLERKAEELYEEAKSKADGGDTAAAAEIARLILKMVPRSTEVYAAAAKLAGR